jgi:predicted  nucleic acid-binding Zn-ribbon protein
MTKQINDLQEERQILATSTTDLKNELDHRKHKSLELNEALEQSIECGKKLEEEFNNFKVAKENSIKEITDDREQLRKNGTEMKVCLIFLSFAYLAILPNYYFSVFRKSMKILNSIIKP